MSCDYFVVPYAKRKIVEKSIGAVFQVVDREKFVIVGTAKTDWMSKLPIAFRFFDDGKQWGWTAYANGKQIASRTDKGVTGKVAEVAKLLRVDAEKLESAADAEKFRKLIGFARYGFTPASYEAADGSDGAVREVHEADQAVSEAGGPEALIVTAVTPSMSFTRIAIVGASSSDVRILTCGPASMVAHAARPHARRPRTSLCTAIVAGCQ